MDISSLKSQDVGELVIKDSAGDDTDMVFVLAGPSHKARLAYERDRQAGMLKEFNRRGKARIPENPDVLYEDETDRLVAMTLGWRNVADGGKEIAFSADAARALYENRELDIREQVQAGLGRRELFTKSSATI